MKKPNLAGAALLLFLLCTGNLLAEQVTVTFNGALGPVVGNVYVNPYSATVSGYGTLTVLCDDFDTTIGNGQIWTANVLDASSPGPVGAKFSYIDTNVYRWLTYLGTELLVAYNTHNTYQQGVLSYAIWSITDHPFDAGPSYHYTTAPQAFRDDVSAAVTDAQLLTHPDYSSNWKILTPVSHSAGQEFLFVVPEPSSFLLLGAGLIAVAGLLRRRR